MSLFASLKSATNATTQIGVAVQRRTENIANANDPNYHRTESTFTYQGDFVRLGANQRVVDEALSRELLFQNGTAGESRTRDSYGKELQQVLGLEGNTPYLTDRFQKFVQSWKDFQANPELDASKTLVVRQAERLTQTIRETSVGLAQIKQGAESSIQNEIRDANRLIREIGRLNIRINRNLAQGQSAAISENQREEALHSLSKIVQIQTFKGENGTLDVYTRSGHLLVSPGTARELSYDVTSREIRTGTGDDALAIASNDNNSLSAGSLRAHYEVLRDGTENTTSTDANRAIIAKYEIMLDNFVTGLTEVIDDADPTNTIVNSFNEAFSRHTDIDPTDPMAPDPELFFNVPATRFDITVNAGILDGSIELPPETVQTETDADNLIKVLELRTRSINSPDIPPNLRQANRSYQEIINGIVSNVSTTVYEYQRSAEVDETVESSIHERLINQVGVNTDQELAHIQQLQTTYAANAKIISTVQEMFNQLLASV